MAVKQSGASMSQSNISNITRQLIAAERKIEIACFHYQHLEKNLPSAHADSLGMPPIPVQAYFEGVVISAFSAIDKVLGALKIQYPNEITGGDQFQLLEIIKPYAPGSKNLIEKESFYNDLRRMRNDAAHASQEKTPSGLAWVVRAPKGSRYSGEREILKYAKTAIEFAKNCSPVIEELKKHWLISHLP